MLCVNCETQLPDDAICCYKCAYPTTTNFTSQPSLAQQVERLDAWESETQTQIRVQNPVQPQQQIDVQKRAPSKPSFAPIVFSAICLVLLVVGGIYLFEKLQDDKNRQKIKTFIRLRTSRQIHKI
jgi:uncharacterized membrane protein YvbJ